MLFLNLGRFCLGINSNLNNKMVCITKKLMNAITLLFIFSIMVKENQSANILGVFPSPFYSHQQPPLALCYALAAKGHNLTILTPNPSKEPKKNVKEYDLSAIYAAITEMQKAGVMSLNKPSDKFQFIKNTCNLLDIILTALIKLPQFKQFISDVNGTKFDLMMYEPLGYSSLLVGVHEMIGNPPIIGIVTLHPFMIIDDPMGNPYTPSYIPSVWLDNDNRMSIWERFINLYAELYSRYILHSCVIPIMEKYKQQLFSNVKHSAMEFDYKTSLLIATIDFATGYPKPLQPNTVYVGPLHLTKPDPLPQDLQNWMDEAEEGVIYFSMGSNIKGKSLPEHVRAAFITAFGLFPKMRVLWKWETDERLPGQPDNVLVKKWFPQNSIFKHPKLKVFISQCGLQSFQEAIENSIPMLAIPMYGDQLYNSRRLVYTGAGLILKFNEIIQEHIYINLKEILTNTSYKENMLRLSAIAKDKPMSSIDTAIWWVEYVLRHNGAPHLRPTSLDLAWYQYYMVDIFAIIIVILSGIAFAIYLCISKLLSSNKNIKIKKN